jgi:hypothetical protein
MPLRNIAVKAYVSVPRYCGWATAPNQQTKIWLDVEDGVIERECPVGWKEEELVVGELDAGEIFICRIVLPSPTIDPAVKVPVTVALPAITAFPDTVKLPVTSLIDGVALKKLVPSQ